MKEKYRNRLVFLIWRLSNQQGSSECSNLSLRAGINRNEVAKIHDIAD